jgi:hypothetical protein
LVAPKGPVLLSFIHPEQQIMSILDHDAQLRSQRGAIVRRVGEKPLAEFMRAEHVRRYYLTFTAGNVILEQRDGQQGWATVEDTTPTAQSNPETTSGPSPAPTAPSTKPSLADALEAVQGPTAEAALHNKIANYARRRGGVLHTLVRTSFQDGSVVSLLRHPGTRTWQEVQD